MAQCNMASRTALWPPPSATANTSGNQLKSCRLSRQVGLAGPCQTANDPGRVTRRRAENNHQPASFRRAADCPGANWPDNQTGSVHWSRATGHAPKVSGKGKCQVLVQPNNAGGKCFKARGETAPPAPLSPRAAQGGNIIGIFFGSALKGCRAGHQHGSAGGNHFGRCLAIDAAINLQLNVAA